MESLQKRRSLYYNNNKKRVVVPRSYFNAIYDSDINNKLLYTTPRCAFATRPGSSWNCNGRFWHGTELLLLNEAIVCPKRPSTRRDIHVVSACSRRIVKPEVVLCPKRRSTGQGIWSSFDSILREHADTRYLFRFQSVGARGYQISRRVLGRFGYTTASNIPGGLLNRSPRCRIRLHYPRAWYYYRCQFREFESPECILVQVRRDFFLCTN